MIAFASSVVVGKWDARTQLTLERERALGDLVVAAARTGNPDEAARNLTFLIEAGLVMDPAGDIATALAAGHRFVLPLPPRTARIAFDPGAVD